MGHPIIMREGTRLSPAKIAMYYKELMRLKKLGKLNRKDVVAEARSRASPIHECFTWDNDRCGDLWRLQEAGHLIKCVVFRIEDEGPIEIPVFHRVEDGSGKKNYEHVDEILERVDYREAIVERALSEAKRQLERYRHYARYFRGTMRGINEDLRALKKTRAPKKQK